MATPFRATRTVTRSSVGTPTVKKSTTGVSNVADEVKRAKSAYDSGFTTSSGNISHNAAAPTTAADTFTTKTSAVDTEPEWLKYAPPIIADNDGDDTSGTQTGVIDDYAEKLKKDRLASLRSAYSQQLTGLEAQKPTIQQEASGLRNTVDTNYYSSLPELYKAMESGGQRGGENITGTVALNAVRGTGRNSADLYEQNQLRNIDTSISNLGAQQTSDEAAITSGIDAESYAAKLQALKDAVSATTAAKDTARTDALSTLGAYSNDYQAQINTLTNDTDASNDYLIPYLQQLRNQKIADQANSASSTSSAMTNLSASEVRSLYKSGLIDYSTAQALLQRLGVTI